MKLVKRGVLTYVESDETLIVRFQKTGGAREQKKSKKMFFFQDFSCFFSVKPLTQGFSITHNLIRSNSKNSEKLVALESINNGKNSFFWRF